MISDEIRNGIKAKFDIQESKNNSKNKGKQEYLNGQKKTPAPRHMYGLIEYMINNIKYSISRRANSGSSESDLMSV